MTKKKPDPSNEVRLFNSRWSGDPDLPQDTLQFNSDRQ